MRHSLLLLTVFAAGAGGCGKSGSGPEAVKAPARSGDVWEIDRAAGRAAMPGAVLAYANGLHVMVLDGKEVFAGMTRFDAEPRPDGARAIKLAGGLEALLVPAGEEKIDLRFSSGESISLLKKKPPKQN
jgi:hypothetical protein